MLNARDELISCIAEIKDDATIMQMLMYVLGMQAQKTLDDMPANTKAV